MCLSFSLVRMEGTKERRKEGRKEGRPTIDTQLTSLNNTWVVLQCGFVLKGDLPKLHFQG